MAKKLALFLDGSWNELDASFPTNVARLVAALPKTTPSGVLQIPYYSQGVGVPDGITQVADAFVRYAGGAWGRGIEAKLMAAYKFLIEQYEPGDDIYVFGFSRGAFTARSLCGLVRTCGILKLTEIARIGKAVGMYRKSADPASAKAIKFRADYSHDVAAGVEDYERVGIKQSEIPRYFETRADLYQYRPLRTYRMMYLGLWDTVASLGLFPPRFHNTDVDVLISSVRHALAIDEKRLVFKHTPISNIDDLNTRWANATGSTWDVVDDTLGNYVPYHFRPYQQVWFPGDHGAIGGGTSRYGLPNAALIWAAEGASAAGLYYDFSPGSELDRIRALIDPNGPWDTFAARGFPGIIPHDRDGPTSFDEISDTAWERSAGAYKPFGAHTFTIPPAPPYDRAPAPHGFPR